SGFDIITAKMLKLCTPVIAKYVTHLVNCCLESGYFPKCWKNALVRPLPKNKEPESCSDLRPISILSTLSKILEKVVYKQMYQYVTTEGILTDLQSGFRKGYSTTTALAVMLDDCIRAFDRGEATVLTLLAFDRLDHALLRAKL